MTSSTTTMSLTFDGQRYSLNLTKTEMVALRKSLKSVLDTATKIGNGQAGNVRSWARENGFEIGQRGRVSAEIYQAYQDATAPKRDGKGHFIKPTTETVEMAVAEPETVTEATEEVVPQVSEDQELVSA